MSLRFVIFFSVLVLVLGSLNLFVHRRLSLGLGLEGRGRRGLGAILVAGLAAMILGRVIAPVWPTAAVPIAIVGSTVQLAAIVACGVLLLERGADLLRRGGAWIAARRAPSHARLRPPAEPGAADEPSPTTPSASAEPTALTRRTVLETGAAWGALAFGGGTAAYGSLWGRHDYVIEEVPIALEKLDPRLDGFTIVQLSDLHIGAFVDEREIRAGLEHVARAQPDLIVLTGDLIDHDPAFAPLLASFCQRLGAIAPVHAIPGNHDHYAGLRTTLRHVQEAGVEVLYNRHRVVGEGRIVLAGVDDVWGARRNRGPDLARALEGADPDLPRVLLSHNPVFFPEAAGSVDLQLSGHTHGGQFNPGVRPADLVLPFGYVAGRYTRGASQLYVNRGFGTAGPPARIGAPPEITRIVLTAARAS